MRKERKALGLGFLHCNEGQLAWLPKNPRQWTQTDIDRTAESIKRDTDFLEDRPLLVVALDKTDFIVFAGNLRYTGAVAAKLSKAPAVIYTPENEDDQETIRRRAMLDNGSFGRWDWDEVFSGPFGNMDLEALGIGKAFQEYQGAIEGAGYSEETPFEPTIDDTEREGADYENAKMTFHFTAKEFAFVSDALLAYDVNKETALLRVLGYEGSAKK